MTLPIAYITISSIYPHMLSSPVFLEKVIGKSLVLNVTQSFHFNTKNQVTHWTMEHDLYTAWEAIIQNPVLTSNVLRKMRIREGLISLSTIQYAMDAGKQIAIQKKGTLTEDVLRVAVPQEEEPVCNQSASKHTMGFLLN